MSHAVINKISAMVKFHNAHVFPVIKNGAIIGTMIGTTLAFSHKKENVKIEVGNTTYQCGPVGHAVFGGIYGYVSGVVFAYTYPISFPLSLYMAFNKDVGIGFKC